jgi:hypothetical protein
MKDLIKPSNVSSFKDFLTFLKSPLIKRCGEKLAIKDQSKVRNMHNTMSFMWDGLVTTIPVSDFNFLSTAEDMINALLQSKENGNVIGIISPALGNGLFMVAVEDIILEDPEPAVKLRSYDITGFFLDKNVLKLSEIRSVCPFQTIFHNPYIAKLRSGT